MVIRDLYRYNGENGTIDTVVVLPMESEKMYRIEADPGMLLTDGENTATVIDIPKADIDKWSEIEGSPEVEPSDDATEADYIAALNELGVDTNEEE